MAINGEADHIHRLIDLNPSISLARVVSLIKSESSHWIKENNLLPGHFNWQKRYSAFSVSNSVKGKVINHIENQEERHRKLRKRCGKLRE